MLGEPNRDVMSELHISEGILKRVRHGAVRGMTRALGEKDREPLQKRVDQAPTPAWALLTIPFLHDKIVVGLHYEQRGAWSRHLAR